MKIKEPHNRPDDFSLTYRAGNKRHPVNLQKKIGGEIAFNFETDRGVLRECEHYAPPALEINGTIYRVIKLGLTADNFYHPDQ